MRLSTSSSISAAERLYDKVSYARRDRQRCSKDLPFGLRQIEPEIDADGDRECGVDKASLEVEGEEHWRSRVAKGQSEQVVKQRNCLPGRDAHNRVAEEGERSSLDCILLAFLEVRLSEILLLRTADGSSAEKR